MQKVAVQIKKSYITLRNVSFDLNRYTFMLPFLKKIIMRNTVYKYIFNSQTNMKGIRKFMDTFCSLFIQL